MSSCLCLAASAWLCPVLVAQDLFEREASCPLSKSAAAKIVNRAEDLRQSGSYASARSLLEDARPCVPEGHVAYAALSNNLAQIYKVIGPRREVEKLLRSAVNAWRGSPYFAGGLANLGDWYQSRKDWRRAEQLFREAVARQPELPIHHNNLGCLLHKRGRYVEASVTIGVLWNSTGGLARARLGRRGATWGCCWNRTNATMKP